MYAIIETGGKQYKVSKGEKVYVENLGLEEGKKVKFENVLAYSDGKKLVAGKPYVKDVSVSGKVVKNGKGKKVIVFKFKAKKGYKRTQGHRQPYTLVEITEIKQVEKKTTTTKKSTATKKTTTTKKTTAAKKATAAKKTAAKTADKKTDKE